MNVLGRSPCRFRLDISRSRGLGDAAGVRSARRPGTYSARSATTGSIRVLDRVGMRLASAGHSFNQLGAASRGPAQGASPRATGFTQCGLTGIRAMTEQLASSPDILKAVNSGMQYLLRRSRRVRLTICLFPDGRDHPRGMAVTKVRQGRDEITVHAGWKSKVYSGDSRFVFLLEGQHIREMRITGHVTLWEATAAD